MPILLTEREHCELRGGFNSLGGDMLMPLSALPVAGLHNAANALAALALTRALGLPMEALLPVHPLSDRRARWNDFLYTFLHRLGLFPVLVFFTVDPLMDGVAGWQRYFWRGQGWSNAMSSADEVATTFAPET